MPIHRRFMTEFLSAAMVVRFATFLGAEPNAGRGKRQVRLRKSGFFSTFTQVPRSHDASDTLAELASQAESFQSARPFPSRLAWKKNAEIFAETPSRNSMSYVSSRGGESSFDTFLR
jgi:hypothetical protein